MIDNNNYLGIIYEFANQQLLKEKTKLKHFLKDKKVNPKKIKKKSINVDFFICEIDIEDQKTLLIEDLGINFLISYTILIGEKTNLIEFIGKKENKETKKYICSKELLNKIKNHFEITPNSIKHIQARKLFNKKYYLKYEQPKIMKHLKEYINSIKKISLNKIHITKNNKIENFVPTIKSEHLKIAKNMNIPLIPLIHNNFIKEATINIYDSKKISQIIKPTFVTTKQLLWDIYKTNNLKLYKDISREYTIRFDKDLICGMILNCPKINFNKNKIVEQIRNIKTIELSSDYGKYPLPIWKSKNEQKFILIKNVEEFNQMSGISFKLEKEKFENLYLQTLSGEKAIYKDKFLTGNLEQCFETLKKDQKIIFSSIKELIIKLIFNHELGVIEIIQHENIKPGKIQELIKKIKWLVEIIISTSININIKPSYKQAENIYEKYYLSSFNSIKKLYEDFMAYPSRKHLLDNSIKHIENLKRSILSHQPTINELYFISLCHLELLKILKTYNPEEYTTCKEHFYSFFPNFENLTKDNKIDTDIENLINDISFAKCFSQKLKIHIIIKKDFDKSLLDNTNIFEEPPSGQKILKPNIPELRKTFKYNYKNIANQINKLTPTETETTITITLNDKKINLKNEHYYIFETYNNYKQILENEYFKILIPR